MTAAELLKVLKKFLPLKSFYNSC